MTWLPMHHTTTAILTLALASACGTSPSTPSLAQSRAAVIYGEDERQEVYASTWQDQAAGVLVLANPELLQQARAGGEVALSAISPVCESWRFSDQPAIAECTGFLLDADVVVTAGHCAVRRLCSEMVFLAGYFYSAEGMLESPLPTADSDSDELRCAEVIALEEGLAITGRSADFAVIRLAEAAPRFTKPQLGSLEGVALNAELTAIGSSAGVPLKTTPGHYLGWAQSTTFEMQAELFGGSSGSPVFNANSEIVGISVRGESDYEPSGGCLSERVVSEDAGLSEEAMPLAPIVEATCAVDDTRWFCSAEEPTSVGTDHPGEAGSSQAAEDARPEAGATPRATGCTLTVPRRYRPPGVWGSFALLAVAGAVLRRRQPDRSADS